PRRGAGLEDWGRGTGDGGRGGTGTRAGGEPHRDRPIGAQGDRGEGTRTLSGGLETETREQRRQHEHGLHHRKALADADPRAAAERKVDVLRKTGGASVEPAVGSGVLGLAPPTGISVGRPGGAAERGTRR